MIHRAVVASLMSSPLVVVPPELTLRDVAICMRDAQVGSAIVMSDDKLAGIISERDVVIALADGADPDVVWAADVMTPDPVWVEPDDIATRALELMLIAGIRHLPVMEEGRLIGIVSLRDVAPPEDPW